MSSKMKKMTLSPRSEAMKRKCEDEKNLHNKHAKSNSENPLNENIFIKACEIVSTNIDEDMLNRFHLQSCLRNWVHRNSNSQEEINEMQPHLEETFNSEMRSNKWYEALQISFLSIKPTQYLSVNILKNIVEIMLNAHEDPLSKYHMTYLIAKCQQVLSLNLKMHPPHTFKLWKHYKQFLTSPMALREKTLTNRKNYESELGICNYCINRLISELTSADSKDGPFFNKEDVVPENLQKIQEIHWIKSRLEIYEMLNRKDRIDRLMAVMDSLAELLGFDLALFHSRKDSQQREMKRAKPLMLEFLESQHTNKDMRQKCQPDVPHASLKIIQIFVYFVHLNYPEKYIKTMSLWINILVESIVISRMQLFNKFSETYKPGSELFNIANKFDSVMTGLPPKSILKVLENITAAPVKYSLGVLFARKLWNATDVDIVKLLINIVKNCRWNDFPETTSEIKLEEKETPKCINSDNILKRLAMICKNHNKSCNTGRNDVYLKFETIDSNFITDRNYAMRILYITFQAYLDNYKVHRLQKTLLQLKNESNQNQFQDSQEPLIKKYSRNTIIPFIAMYRTIYNGLRDYFSLLKSLKSQNELPEIFYNFEQIIDLNEL